MSYNFVGACMFVVFATVINSRFVIFDNVLFFVCHSSNVSGVW